MQQQCNNNRTIRENGIIYVQPRLLEFNNNGERITELYKKWDNMQHATTEDDEQNYTKY
jgi:hypothetical protein